MSYTDDIALAYIISAILLFALVAHGILHARKVRRALQSMQGNTP